jgi:hypothetical protein
MGETQAKREICRAIVDRRLKFRFRIARKKRTGSADEHAFGDTLSGIVVKIPKDLNPNDFDWEQSRPLKPWRQRFAAGVWHIEWIEILIEGADAAIGYFEGPSVQVPPHLTAADFDWENSRPLRAWPISPPRGRPGEWRSHPVELIELYVPDLDNLLRGTKSANRAAGESTSSAPGDHAVAESTPSTSRDDDAGNGASLSERDGAPAPARRKSRSNRELARRVIDELYPGGLPDQATEPNGSLCERVGNKLKDLGLRNVSDDTILRAAGRRK